MTTEQKRILELEQIVTKQAAFIKSLVKIIEQLEARLSKYETPKDSSNSSIPPSKDENRPKRTQSLREAGKKKSGGQLGHKGTTLEMTTQIDNVVEHLPGQTCACGHDLGSIEGLIIERRQVMDIPPINLEVTEHRLFQKTCNCCGRTLVGNFPSGITPGISYGAGVESVAAYMYARQYLPFDRMREFFNDVLHVPISEGALYQAILRVAEKALPSYENIRAEVESANVTGTDETGARIECLKAWFWTWQTKLATFIAASMDRGTKTIDRYFPNGFINAVFVHDCWKSHFEPTVANHQICLAHLLRELKYFDDRYKNPWSVKMRKLLLDALDLKASMTKAQYCKKNFEPRKSIHRRFVRLLNKKLPDKSKEMITFQKRLLRYRDYVFTFLIKEEVPADNNASERAIRNIKVKQKISGYFRTLRGAQTFAILRSITDTARKKNQNILTAIYQIALS
jgi:transposase